MKMTMQVVNQGAGSEIHLNCYINSIIEAFWP